MIDCLSSLLVKSRGFAHLAALGLVSTMLRCVTVKVVELVDLTEMRKTDCFGDLRLLLHVPAHHELEREFIITIEAQTCKLDDSLPATSQPCILRTSC